MDICEFSVPVEPRPKGRARKGANGFYTPTETKQYEAAVGLFARQAVKQPNLLDDLGVEVVFTLGSRQRKDIDNMVKAVFDGMNGIVWRDDAQVTRLAASIQHEGPVGTTVRVYVAHNRSVLCERCAKPLRHDQIGKNSARFCSKACYDTEQRKGVYRACKTCGKQVYRKTEKASAIDTFCSEGCRTARRGLCRNCGARLTTPPTAANVTCSATCAREYHSARGLKVTGGECVDCGGPCSRKGGRCRACHLSRNRV